MTKLLGISGSLRAGSTNTMLVKEAARLFEADAFELADLNLPLYHGDAEAASGIPEAVQRLADQIDAADAVVIATPEYNKALSGVLKNALDWVSRTDGNVWAGKPVAIMSATAGRSGGERAQYSLRWCMTPFQADVLQGPEVLVGSNSKEFDDNGQLLGELYIKGLTKLMGALKARI